ncbi:MAG: signal peptidase II [Bdellovibrionales bacterium]
MKKFIGFRKQKQPFTYQASMSIFMFLAILLLAGCDIGTKTAINSSLVLNESFDVVPHFFSITHVKNPGVAFGLFANSQSNLKFIFIFFIPLIVILFLTYKLKSLRSRTEILGYVLIIGGAAGNFVDRMLNGHVTDFLDFHFRTFYWPVFNLADIFIVLGITLLFSLPYLKNYHRKKAELIN